ncbi:E3 ubiquitin-protein ligase TRIM39-like [Mya arenaria]|uniref:E3 ubiquitin-protein ligase TRIM39-like n=1 Tax=Mya arenaria TaxID=6604 RepID=UPI0022E26714|nr:E3 ubiquitin-protein ligase TRIM39-like [Mya arenaria]XP_052793081.1 E3 ubiquitin-protein ligase TRIM39-like [Mya arenaria]XP_052793083.1 E3 ubiquitin-protein ligase TRIM39-like [Mya arenaria]
MAAVEQAQHGARQRTFNQPPVPPVQQTPARAAGNRRTSSEYSDHVNCSICMNQISRAVISTCGHRFCKGCIEGWLDRRKHSCPVCRGGLSTSRLIADPAFDDVIAILERLSTQIQVQQIDASMQPSMHSSQEAERIISELSQVRQDANVTLGSFQQKVSELGVYVGDYTRNHEELQRLRVTVPEQERKIQELEQTRDRLVAEGDTARTEIGRLHGEVQRLHKFEALYKEKEIEAVKLKKELKTLADKCVKQQTDLNTFRKACEDRQKSLKEKVEEIDNYKVQLGQKLNELGECRTNLENYVAQCELQANVIQKLNDDIIPEKDTVISILRKAKSNLEAELQCFTKGVTLLSDLKTLPGSKLHIAIADLKRFYEQEYRRQPVVLAHTKMILQQKIQQVVADESFLELGENIANALNAYLATVEESSSLHADVKRQAIEIQRLKKQLQHLKDASILQPEE